MPDIKHEGLHTKRLHPKAGNPLEVDFSELWKEENARRTGRPTPLLGYLLGEFDQRDATVAATVIQWLGSPIGQSFLEEVKKRNA